MKNGYNWYTNKDCEFYPCHKSEKDLNCMFCFCPLHSDLNCGGNYIMIGDEKDIKDCSNCLLPHNNGGYNYIINKLWR